MIHYDLKVFQKCTVSVVVGLFYFTFRDSLNMEGYELFGNLFCDWLIWYAYIPIPLLSMHYKGYWSLSGIIVWLLKYYVTSRDHQNTSYPEIYSNNIINYT